MHGTFMVFFAIMPLLVGVYANILIPLKIGTHDMAFPRINMWSFWSAFAAGLVMLASLFVPEGAARAGWTMYAPAFGPARLLGRGARPGALVDLDRAARAVVDPGLAELHHHGDQQPRPRHDWFRMPLSVWAL